MTPAEFEQEAAFLAELEDFLREKGDEQGLLLAVKAHANLQLILTNPETLSDMLPPQEEQEADLARLAEIQELRAENERLRADVERLLVDNAELSDECDQWAEKVADCWREIEQLRSALRREQGC